MERKPEQRHNILEVLPPLGQGSPAGLSRAEAMTATWPAPLGLLSESKHFSYRAAACGLLAGSK